MKMLFAGLASLVLIVGCGQSQEPASEAPVAPAEASAPANDVIVDYVWNDVGPDVTEEQFADIMCLGDGTGPAQSATWNAARAQKLADFHSEEHLKPFLDFFFDDSHYYIECLAALDSPGEWGFDYETNQVYLWPLNDADPNDHAYRGKIAEYNIHHL